MSTTALAHGLVRDFGPPCRTAHQITSRALQSAPNPSSNQHLDARLIREIARDEIEQPQRSIRIGWMTSSTPGDSSRAARLRDVQRGSQ